ncbi:MAG: LLM class flavin-dependent oxidoreductase [Actinomycetales bacterium]|nr:LLM class flavin-dependent oxidoreductase [Actinomycetales bacterium]
MRHPYASEREFVELAQLAETSGWDAVFSWEAVWGQDAWATLAAAAVLTSRVRLGTLLTPASRHRPWDLASRVATVDRLSAGRVTMCVGLGALHGNWLAFEADEGRAARAQKLDESLAIYAGLMAGQPFSYTGEHYSATPVTELVPPPPVQRPHPPVWVVGAMHLGRHAQPSLDRAARREGLLPAVVDPAFPADHHRGDPARGRPRLQSAGRVGTADRRLRRRPGRGHLRRAPVSDRHTGRVGGRRGELVGRELVGPARRSRERR